MARADTDMARQVWRAMSEKVLDHDRRVAVADALGLSFARVRALRRLAAEPGIRRTMHVSGTLAGRRLEAVWVDGIVSGDPLVVTMVEQLPENAVWASFALGRMQMPWVAQSVLLGGHVRVGLEDNLYLSRGVKATNAQLVERARTIVESMGAHVATPDEGREILALRPR